MIGSTSFVAKGATTWLLNEAISSTVEVSSPEVGANWGLVLKCYELRTRQHKMLIVKDLHPLKHCLP
jgi:hypothetical protein